ncbi:MAG TPA: 2Fe-2S iron-sulfur cluster-binding protein [Anaerolineales bacterium]|nr:2Fe-2S iron-sulfur cluster-binding protein [Anaerolineales bacterium]
MPDELHVVIDGVTATVPPGSTILQAAGAVAIDIPVLCYFEHTTSNGLCRLCVVETEGARGLQAACVSVPREGAVIHTRSENVLRARRTILEMLAATVDLSEAPEVQRRMEEVGARPERFAGGARREPPMLDDNPMYIRDYAKCVLCWRCVQVCAEDAQYTYALNFTGRGFHTSIGTFFDQPMPQTTCVFCGQCVGVCPTGALKGKREYLLQQGVAPEDILRETRPPRHARRRERSDEEAEG